MWRDKFLGLDSSIRWGLMLRDLQGDSVDVGFPEMGDARSLDWPFFLFQLW